MKLITSEEASELAKQGYGVSCFMGGFGGDKTKPFIEIVEDEHWLVERDEINSKEYKELRERQKREAKEYCDAYERSH